MGSAEEFCPMHEDEPVFWPVSQLVEAFQSRQLSPVEVAEGVLERIGAFDSKLNAYITVTSEIALEQARDAETLFTGRNEPLPPLLGVPTAIKDLFQVAGAPTSFGSLVYRERLAERDSELVARLRRAGTVFIGKTNTAEFGQSATTENRLGPECGNPWDPSRTTGGSSGGAAAAVGAGLTTVALGSDGGGSIRIPAAMCGLFGLKLTHGSIPEDQFGLRAMTGLVSGGPIVRRVEDARAFVGAVLEGDFTRRPRRGRLRVGWCPAPHGRPVDTQVAATTSHAVARLTELGHEVEEISLPVDDWMDAFRPLVLADEWRYRRDLLDQRAQDLTEYARRSIEAAGTLTEGDIRAARQSMHEIRDRITRLFEDHDLVVTPTSATVAFLHGQRPIEIDNRSVDALWGAFPFTPVFNLSGSPAASVPCGLSYGMPVGLQVVGPDRSEVEILNFCQDLEETLEFPVTEMSKRWAVTEATRAAAGEIAIERRRQIALIQFARTDKRNALTRVMLTQLRQALSEQGKSGVAAVVLTGSSAEFSAGFDVSELGRGTLDLTVDESIADAVRAIKALPIPVVAAIEGPCVGAALELALACDVRIAGAGSIFHLPAARLGVLYRPDGIHDFVGDVGRQTASRLLLMGDRINADEAACAGIVARVVQAGTALESALELAEKAGGSTRRATSATKALITEITTGEQMGDEWEEQRRGLLASKERQEALESVKERLRGSSQDGPQ
jgi:Asp-tRNA(Asn)/Glu-tRNA(Gln) amidotransferase A subunit family amidase/enoyl-CoA hydratase/carnithine racemase